MNKNIAELFKDAVKSLNQNYDDRESEQIAYILFEEIGYNKHFLLTNPETIAEEKSINRLNSFLTEMSKGRPVQYVIGKAYFLDFILEVSEGVLIPRPETEELVVKAYSVIENFPEKPQKILDVGTGSGCIAISLKHKFPDIEVTALDNSTDALNIAKKNAKKLGVDIHFLQADFLEDEIASDVYWDLIVSNPPYVKKSEMEGLEKHVRDFEPMPALFPPGEDACIFYRNIAAYGAKQLTEKGKVIVEIHPDLHKEIKEIFEAKGFKKIEILKDFSGRKRILVGER
ncbi:MAG: peptide chain release factor N(5)-glutamine methyltransferase [Chitinophagaceae bacterium]|nr:MAG: peptide chain release factor N(5)-glutamine methyltransferase [Chitinophagaceae bacterium]